MKRPSNNSKKGGAKAKGAPAAKKAKVNDAAFDWGENNIASDAEDSEDDAKAPAEDEEDPYAHETADETRVRLAKAYLGKLKDTMDEDDGSDAEANARVSSQLDLDVQEASGKLFKKVAEKFTAFEFDEESSKYLSGHKAPVSVVAAVEDGKTIYSAAKDGSLLKWTLSADGITKVRMELPKAEDAAKGKKAVPDHKKTVLALAVSSDGKFVASGGVDKLLHVWDSETSALLESFSGHRDAISSLAFRKKSHMLFSGSFDRTVKHWNLTEMGYVETLFGHQTKSRASTVSRRTASCRAAATRASASGRSRKRRSSSSTARAPSTASPWSRTSIT
ncbi:hypothetical protein SPRG_03851 [Saprolegnia parasitica CBS 223.65]|uniref:Uncharacterized protein n=1 Tax=Saprolegnia parasitica (strain CBS 223.65) TaxID=695850 RepID=A0A067CL64_SAPPC|nr:hypothetical protein SPRG_03851 [Saprolegnia parasitica CBS 223.65]KDO31233.1 hypothetical protein SPRG_03851 [Saprolegnia parasitica CBS 223.65]|eukprot:XP_012197838.1 hypothetical protein SPRG_03851 [Saprolegnia parasitica CBS 223.65]